jgi:hypothetical protein
MPTVPGIGLPTDGSGQVIRQVQPPGYVDGSGQPVGQEVDTLGYSDGTLADADLQKLRNLDISITALRDAVRGTDNRSLSDLEIALGLVHMTFKPSWPRPSHSW